MKHADGQTLCVSFMYIMQKTKTLSESFCPQWNGKIYIITQKYPEIRKLYQY